MRLLSPDCLDFASRALADHGVRPPFDIEELWRDDWTHLVRVRDRAASRSALLLVAPAEAPEPVVRKMRREADLLPWLDDVFAALPRSLLVLPEAYALLLEDPGGDVLGSRVGGEMDTGAFLRLASAIARSLERAHAAGVVHRDLRPGNILVRDDGSVRLTGFGNASRLQKEPPSPSGCFEGLDALPYISPEQTGRVNRAVDSRSDLYSLGVNLYQLLTGHLPFVANGVMEWVHCHVARTPVAIGEHAPAQPRQLVDIIGKLLAKAAEDRYQTASGLAADLERCALEWSTTGRIARFALHQEDVSRRLVMPQKLYGRDAPLDALVAAYRRVAERGGCELVLVSGRSGVGKSSVVGELQRHVVERHGHFASGKFEQNKKDVPYSTLAQSFRGLVGAVLCLSECEVERWRVGLCSHLGASAALLKSLVPELETLLGTLPDPAEVSPTEAATRFQLAIRNFVAAFAAEASPLVLFIDDLQWLDTATLELLRHLVTHDEVRDLVLIGAYRSDEVGADHELLEMVRAVREQGVCTTAIVLETLRETDLRELVADALKVEPGDISLLASHLHEQTQGNPFFALQLLATLGDENLIRFDRHTRSWTWDLDRIRSSAHGRNVGDFLLGKLARLPEAVRSDLQMLSCFGSTATTACIEAASDGGPVQLDASLAIAEHAGLVCRNATGYQFVHDRIQEAAYASIPAAEKPRRHLEIARKLCASLCPADLDANIFDVVNQLASGAWLLVDPGEKTRAAALFLEAGTRAKSETAYDAALTYLDAANAMLSDDRWTACYALAAAIGTARAECEFLLGNLLPAEAQLADLAHRARGIVDKAGVTWLQVTLYTALDRSDLAIGTCLDFLDSVGIDLPRKPDDGQVRREYDLLFQRLEAGGGMSLLMDLPPVRDSEQRAILDVVAAMLAPAFFSDENLVCLALCRMANLSLSHGNCDASALAYAYLGMVVGPRFSAYTVAFEFGRTGYELVEHRGLARYRARVYMCFAYHVSAWARPLRENLGLLRRAYEVARENGDVTYAGFSSCTLVTTLISSGEHLAAVQREGRERLRYVTGAKFGLVADIMAVQLQLIATLRGETPVFGSFDDALFSEREFEGRLVANRNLDIATCWYWIRKAQARFLAGRSDEALEATEKAEPLLWTSSGHFELAQYHLCGALIRTACCEKAAPERRAELLSAVAVHLVQLRTWAVHCPETFAMRVALVEAEVAAVEGRTPEAMQGYERALNAGRVLDSPQHQALALELGSRFYLRLGLHGVSAALMAQARDQYDRWGAKGKVAQLESENPALRDSRKTTPVARTPLFPLESIDAAAMLKTSQAVSGDVGLDKLMRALMVIALEHAGANQGLLILPKGDQLRVEARARFGPDGVEVQVQSRAIGPSDLPMSILHFVMRTSQTVLLDDARQAEHFATDPYIVESRCQSVLCLPLTRQGELIAVLYLENTLVSHVFTQSRVAILNLLVSTAALSVENASLEEKESLLKEVHHRVKNNLQLISSLLSLQASRISDPAVSELFAESRNRVRSMALVHENLYRAGNFARVPMPTHLRKLCAELARAYGMASRDIETLVEVDDVQLDLSRAVSCGLIVNELVSNALKHAFPGGRHGRVVVRLRVHADAACELSVSDDGIGLPADVDAARAASLGLQLVDDLAAQLQGRLSVRNAPGAEFSIRFRTDDARAAP